MRNLGHAIRDHQILGYRAIETCHDIVEPRKTETLVLLVWRERKSAIINISFSFIAKERHRREVGTPVKGVGINRTNTRRDRHRTEVRHVVVVVVERASRNLGHAIRDHQILGYRAIETCHDIVEPRKTETLVLLVWRERKSAIINISFSFIAKERHRREVGTPVKGVGINRTNTRRDRHRTEARHVVVVVVERAFRNLGHTVGDDDARGTPPQKSRQNITLVNLRRE